MPEWDYSFQAYEAATMVRASARDVDISHKAAREVCRAIGGLKLAEAKSFLEAVTLLRKPVAFGRYNKEGSHRRGLADFHSGRFPIKTGKKLLELLENLEANADYKGLDLERLVIVHAAAYPGRKVRGFTPRAFGRASPSVNTLTHVELVAEEK